jgi:hypothetical protein
MAATELLTTNWNRTVSFLQMSLQSRRNFPAPQIVAAEIARRLHVEYAGD